MRGKIFLDPGHGGDDNGAVWGYAEEDDLNLAIAEYVKDLLENISFEVFMSRTEDTYVKLSQRVKMANREKTHLFISIHCDAFHNVTASGMSVHIYNRTKVSSIPANCINDEFVRKFPNHKQRGVKRSNFHVLRETRMPAILLECEFISNPETREWLGRWQNQLALAEAIVTGIEHWFDVKNEKGGLNG